LISFPTANRIMFQEVATAAFATAITVEKEVSTAMYYVSALDVCPQSSSSCSSPSSILNSASTTHHQSYSLWIWTTAILFGLYTVVQVLSNAVFWYQFFVAWSLIARANRVEVNLVHHHKTTFTNRKNHIHQAIQTNSYSEHVLRLALLRSNNNNNNTNSKDHTQNHLGMATTASRICDSVSVDDETSSCPICLMDFEASDQVSACKDNRACCHFFHEKCLKDWLYKQPSCPCCRFNILPLSLPPTELPPPRQYYS
jgi:hypothetical protein